MKLGYLKTSLLLTAAAFCFSASAFESLSIAGQKIQEEYPATGAALEFRPQMVAYQVELLNCQARKSGIRIEMKGSEFMPAATGEVKAKSDRRGTNSIDARFENLDAPGKFGEQYMTYILWSGTPQDICVNLGELELKDSRSRLKIKSALQALALFVTAEPYVEVSQPGSLVVLRQTGSPETPEANTGITAKAELLRGGYAPIGYIFEPLNAGIGQPPLFRQALNARRIAQIAQAEKYASREFDQAEDLYEHLVGTVMAHKRPKKSTLKTAVTVIKYFDRARAVSISRQVAAK